MKDYPPTCDYLYGTHMRDRPFLHIDSVDDVDWLSNSLTIPVIRQDMLRLRVEFTKHSPIAVLLTRHGAFKK